ncbi:MAG: hypothetical protein GWP10_03645 [Nitrospiraceae bacterium]|nr:hypothetical protein [Nitrospiraceae bacterium]
METDKKIRSCIRSGKCCEKGGPSLHLEDKALLQGDILRPRDLLTLRAGELAYHPIEKKLIELPKEIIKIKSRDGSTACMFYDADRHACSIYEHRPLECRVFKCWDTKAIEEIFLKDTLSRLDLFPKDSSITELISAYDKTLPPGQLYSLFSEMASQDEAQQEAKLKVEEVVSTDDAFRKKVIETLGIDETELEFFFGRSLKALISNIQSIMDVNKS